MTDPFNPDGPSGPEYEPGEADPGPVDPGGPEIPGEAPQELPQR
jgi:hypothetical protein